MHVCLRECAGGEGSYVTYSGEYSLGDMDANPFRDTPGPDAFQRGKELFAAGMPHLTTAVVCCPGRAHLPTLPLCHSPPTTTSTTHGHRTPTRVCACVSHASAAGSVRVCTASVWSRLWRACACA